MICERCSKRMYYLGRTKAGEKAYKCDRCKIGAIPLYRTVRDDETERREKAAAERIIKTFDCPICNRPADYCGVVAQGSERGMEMYACDHCSKPTAKHKGYFFTRWKNESMIPLPEWHIKHTLSEREKTKKKRQPRRTKKYRELEAKINKFVYGED